MHIHKICFGVKIMQKLSFIFVALLLNQGFLLNLSVFLKVVSDSELM